MTNNTNFYLFIDDIRNPDSKECTLSGVDPNLNWFIVRSSKEAINAVKKYGMPSHIAFDHDLGTLSDNSLDDSMIFLNWLANRFWKPGMPLFKWTIHSANPVGVQRIHSFMKSWEKIAANNT